MKLTDIKLLPDCFYVSTDEALIREKVKVKQHLRSEHGKVSVVKQHMREQEVSSNEEIKIDDKTKEIMDKYGQEESPEKWGISKDEFEDALKRIYNQLRKNEYFDNQKEFIERDPRAIGLELDSDGEINKLYFKNLPDDINPTDLVIAYKHNLLPNIKRNTELNKIDIPEEINANTISSLGEPKYKEKNEGDKLINLQEDANKRRNSKNSNIVDNARYELFVDQMMNSDLSKRLNMKESEVNRKIKTQTGMNKKSAEIHQRVNNNLDQPVQQNGLINSSYISKKNVEPKIIDNLVKKIDVDDNVGWSGNNGEFLRNYIARTMLGIDTRIKYSDLSFKIGNLEKPTIRGRYNSRGTIITIANNNPNTVAHEVGHYIDNKQGRELNLNMNDTYASSAMDELNIDVLKENISPIRFKQMNKFNMFTKEISKRSNISSEYTQRRSEVFARFISNFIGWVGKNTGEQGYENLYHDDFNEKDYLNFIRLLQEKSYVDIIDENR